MNNAVNFPTVDQLKSELIRSTKNKRARNVLRDVLITLMLIILFAFAASYYFFSVIQVRASGMSPTLENNNIVVGIKKAQPNKGDIIAFYFQDQLLVKRIIAIEGDIVSISSTGAVTVNGNLLNEPYVSIRNSTSECDIEFPFTVPPGRFFVLGDNRAVSLDSRHKEIGCVAQEQIAACLLFRIWPLQQISLLNAEP